MVNLLSYVGVNLQSELCLWTLLGILRTIFDATLFKVNANLKQVWQMQMPTQLSMPVQRALRTTISGVMLVQCFTVYVYLAAYVVLLYPVFLEERPSLVLPWLLLAAVRKFLCELTSLTLGLGVCVLLGPARPPCIKFLVFKVASIMPAFYMWVMVYSYYNALKVASTYKRYPSMMVASSDHDYGFELAVRRRCTKSLLGEEQLRKTLTNLHFNEKTAEQSVTPKISQTGAELMPKYSAIEMITTDILNLIPPINSDPENIEYQDWYGNDVMVPRDGDRIMEQFIIMLLRIGIYLKSDETDLSKLFSQHSREPILFNCTNLRADGAETPPSVGNTGGKVASYLQDYPNIFQKKTNDSIQLENEHILSTSHNLQISDQQEYPAAPNEKNNTKFRNETPAKLEISTNVKSTTGNKPTTETITENGEVIAINEKKTERTRESVSKSVTYAEDIEEETLGTASSELERRINIRTIFEGSPADVYCLQSTTGEAAEAQLLILENEEQTETSSISNTPSTDVIKENTEFEKVTDLHDFGTENSLKIQDNDVTDPKAKRELTLNEPETDTPGSSWSSIKVTNESGKKKTTDEKREKEE